MKLKTTPQTSPWMAVRPKDSPGRGRSKPPADSRLAGMVIASSPTATRTRSSWAWAECSAAPTWGAARSRQQSTTMGMGGVAGMSPVLPHSEAMAKGRIGHVAASGPAPTLPPPARTERRVEAAGDRGRGPQPPITRQEHL